MQNYFTPGQTVLVREIWQGKIWTARPMVLVQDTTDLLAFYWVPGTNWKRARNHQGGEVPTLERKMQKWELHDDVWKGEGTLRLSIPDAKYSVIIFRNTNNTLSNWYINLEDPPTRTDRGFDYTDQILDIIAEPDLKTWHWKDEDEFQEAQDLGLISAQEAKLLRTEGEKALKLLQSGKSIFNDWEHWKPDPSWKVPVLSDNWDVI
jgi:predicted RNA-binding protein associated with RNAse of E/G family